NNGMFCGPSLLIGSVEKRLDEAAGKTLPLEKVVVGQITFYEYIIRRAIQMKIPVTVACDSNGLDATTRFLLRLEKEKLIAKTFIPSIVILDDKISQDNTPVENIGDILIVDPVEIFHGFYFQFNLSFLPQGSLRNKGWFDGLGFT
ncbi:MAG: hypothetical protein WCO18_01470, partial [bacterium]